MANRGQHHRHSQADSEDVAMAEVLDLDAELLHEHHSEVTAWLEELAGDQPPHRILDLGSGTGTGTFALLERFPRAEATALDVSPHMLYRLLDRARALGLEERVRAIQADLDATWPALDPVDLEWVASSLHHTADPGHVLAEAFKALRPGGLLVVTEIASFPRFLPDQVGRSRPGLEERLHAVQRRNAPEDPSPILLRVGFTVEAKRAFDIAMRPPLPPAAGRYAQTVLRRMRLHLEGQLDAEDRATLDTLIADEGPESVLRREDLSVRTTRTVLVARRP